jgi:sugar lactone lactonase YvrE
VPGEDQKRAAQTLTNGIVFGESPRWGPDGRLYVADWGAHELLAVDLSGNSEIVARFEVPWFQPFSVDFVPDGTLVAVWAPDSVMLRVEGDGMLVPHADLDRANKRTWNEIVVDGRGRAYINDVGFNLALGEPPAPGRIALLTPDGELREVADGLAFPNGMAVTADNSTLICAESHAKRLTAFDIAADGSLSNKRLGRPRRRRSGWHLRRRARSRLVRRRPQQALCPRRRGR